MLVPSFCSPATSSVCKWFCWIRWQAKGTRYMCGEHRKKPDKLWCGSVECGSGQLAYRFFSSRFENADTQFLVAQNHYGSTVVYPRPIKMCATIQTEQTMISIDTLFDGWIWISIIWIENIYTNAWTTSTLAMENQSAFDCGHLSIPHFQNAIHTSSWVIWILITFYRNSSTIHSTRWASCQIEKDKKCAVLCTHLTFASSFVCVLLRFLSND